MLKMTIDNEEVVSDKDITINEEMLSASSTILNNVYPKEWEEDKDYTSKFYYPQDYSKALIQRSYVTQEAEAGTTIQVNGSATLTDVDTTKNSRVLRLLGQTSQSGTPTPSSPIPINVVSGNNSIEICGKNLINNSLYRSYTNNGVTFTPNSDGSITISGTATSTVCDGIMMGNWSDNTKYINLDTTSTYTMGMVGNTNKKITMFLIHGTSVINYTQTSNTFTPNYDSVGLLMIRYIGAVGDVINTTVYPMLVKGSTTLSTYEPYQGNTYNIDLRTSKNLFNKDTIINGKVLASNGALNDSNGYIVGDYIRVKPSTQYTISFDYTAKENLRIGYYQKDKTFIDRPYSGDRPWTITTPSNCYYIRICTPDNYTNVQCEEGNQQTTYEAYSSIELCKIGTYQDYIYKDSDKWYLHKEIGKVVLNGSEPNWNVVASSNLYRAEKVFNILPYTDINRHIGRFICSHFYPNTNNEIGVIFQYQSTLLFYVSSGITTVEQWKTWLGNNNTTLYYVLPTPTNTEITYTELLNQLNALSSQ